jgi:deoxyadenosine/deoxycytidine kinase
MKNPYLDDFYKDMKRWSFQSQIYFLSHKFRLHMGLPEIPNTVIQDRTIYEDAEIFCTNLYQNGDMSKRDYKTYMELYHSMRAALQPPDLLIYLRCSVKAVQKRIRSRGRNSEQKIPKKYLTRLHNLYEGWVENYTLSPVMIWESDKMDYLTDLVDRIEFHQTFERFLNSSAVVS